MFGVLSMFLSVTPRSALERTLKASRVQIPSRPLHFYCLVDARMPEQAQNLFHVMLFLSHFNRYPHDEDHGASASGIR